MLLEADNTLLHLCLSLWPLRQTCQTAVVLSMLDTFCSMDSRTRRIKWVKLGLPFHVLPIFKGLFLKCAPHVQHFHIPIVSRICCFFGSVLSASAKESYLCTELTHLKLGRDGKHSRLGLLSSTRGPMHLERSCGVTRMLWA